MSLRDTDYTNTSQIPPNDMQMSMPEPPCERFGEELVSQVESVVIRVFQIRSGQLSGDDRKSFEYLVDENLTWITEDQSRISLSPKMLSELKGNYLSSSTLV
jgi:hypothetical protein